MWMAGGGVKAGFVYGETDDFSFVSRRAAQTYKMRLEFEAQEWP